MTNSATEQSPGANFMDAAQALTACYGRVKSLNNLTTDPEELLQQHETLDTAYRDFLEAFNAFRVEGLFRLYLDMSTDLKSLMDANDLDRMLNSGSDMHKTLGRQLTALKRLDRYDMLERLRSTYGNGVYAQRIIEPQEPRRWLSIMRGDLFTELSG